jgi:AraC-like DNA-binding protein
MKKHLKLLWYGEDICSPYQHFGPAPRSCYIIHYVISGAGYLTVLGKTQRIEPKSAFLINAGEVVEYHPDPSDPWHYVWIDFGGDIVADLLLKTGFSVKQRVAENIPPESILPIFSDFEGKLADSDSELLGMATMIKLLSEISRHFPKIASDDAGGIAERAAELIRGNFRSLDCRVERLAEILSVSRSHLYRAFKEKYGKSPKEFIDDCRIDYAKNLLASSDEPISSVAYSSGFPDPLYFSASFKRRVGVSPSRFRGG